MNIVVIMTIHRVTAWKNNDAAMFVRHARSLCHACRTLKKQPLSPRTRPCVVRHAFFIALEFGRVKKSKQIRLYFLIAILRVAATFCELQTI